MSTLIICFLLTVTIVTVSSSERNVVWYIYSNPVQIGKDLDLFCNITQNPCATCVSRWNKGNELLAHGKVVNPSKHVLSQKDGGVVLTIKNLTYSDINENYGCYFNFRKFTKNLTLPETFEHLPTKESIKGFHSVKGRNLSFKYHFEKVHPEPNCTLHFNKADLSKNVKSNVTSNGIWLNVTLEAEHTVTESQNSGRLILTCSVGTTTDTYYDVVISIDDEDKAGLSPWSVVFIISLCGLIISSVIVGVIWRRKCISNRGDLCMHDDVTKGNCVVVIAPLIEIPIKQDDVENVSTQTWLVSKEGNCEGKSSDYLQCVNSEQNEPLRDCLSEHDDTEPQTTDYLGVQDGIVRQHSGSSAEFDTFAKDRIQVT